MRIAVVQVIFFSLFACLPSASAQQAEIAVESVRRVTAVRIPNGRIAIDGRLDEAEWAKAAPASGFVQQQPDEGSPTTELTEIRFLYDDETLFVGGMLYDSEPEKLVTNELKRDFNARDGDLFVLVLDTFKDRRNSYGFQTNPAGAQRDTQSYDDGRTTNQNFDCVWYLKATVFEKGWRLEYAIPFKSLRFSQSEEQVWGVNIFRLIRRKNEITLWSPVPRQYSQFKVSYAGVLEGIRGVAPGRNIRIKPFFASSYTRRTSSSRSEADGGLDAKIGLGSNLVLDATYRTDFSQVEADEQQVNLTRFSLFFPEKREFFLENQGAFHIGPPLPRNDARSLQSSGPPDFVPFFSRSIGLSASGEPVPILGGLRLSGRSGRFNIGVLHIRTEKGDARLQPSEGYSVMRVGRDFWSNSSASAFYLGKEFGSASNRVGGADLRLSLRRTTDVDAMWMRSTRTGTGSGTAWRLGFTHDSNLNRVSASATALGKEFRDELGFIPRPDVRIVNASAARRFRPRATYRYIREYRPEAAYARFTKQGIGVETATATPSFNIDLNDGSQFRALYRFNEEAITQPFRLRQGFTIGPGRYRFNDGEIDFSTSRARRLSLSGGYRFGGFWDGHRSGYSAGGRFRFSAKLATSLNYSRDTIELQNRQFSTDLVALRVDSSFSTRMFLNAFVQYNSVSREVVSNVRFNFIHHPLSDLYLVYNETRTTSGAVPASRALILKVTHLLAF